MALTVNQRVLVASVIAVAVILVGVDAFLDIGPDVHRPDNVPPDADRAPGIAKTSIWITCRYDAQNDVCQIFNPVGETLYDGVFLPCDDGPAVTATELRINPLRSSSEFVVLENGRTLSPRSDVENLQRFGQEFHYCE